MRMTSTVGHHIYTHVHHQATRAQVVGLVMIIIIAWWSMVAGSVVVARHALQRSLRATCTSVRVEHGPARLVWLPDGDPAWVH